MQAWLKDDEACRIAAIPGVGLLTATAAVTTMGDPKAFRSGREFAAWLGLVPKQVGTGGKIVLLGISKRGATYCGPCSFMERDACCRTLGSRGHGSSNSPNGGIVTWPK
jgi:transposase